MIFNNKKRPFLKGWTQVTSIRKEHELSLECRRVAKYQRQYYIDYKEYKANYFDNRRHESDLVNPRIELYYPFFKEHVCCHLFAATYLTQCYGTRFKASFSFTYVIYRVKTKTV